MHSQAQPIIYGNLTGHFDLHASIEDSIAAVVNVCDYLGIVYESHYWVATYLLDPLGVLFQISHNENILLSTNTDKWYLKIIEALTIQQWRNLCKYGVCLWSSISGPVLPLAVSKIVMFVVGTLN